MSAFNTSYPSSVIYAADAADLLATGLTGEETVTVKIYGKTICSFSVYPNSSGSVTIRLRELLAGLWPSLDLPLPDLSGSALTVIRPVEIRLSGGAYIRVWVMSGHDPAGCGIGDNDWKTLRPQIARCAKDSHEMLWSRAVTLGGVIIPTVRYITESGKTGTVTLPALTPTTQNFNYAGKIDCSYQTVKSLAGEDLVSYDVALTGGYSQRFVVTGRHYTEYLFRNSFGVWDNILAFGRQELIVEPETAVITADGIEKEISNVSAKSVRQDSGHLDSASALRFWEDFLASRERYVIENGEAVRIVVDEHEEDRPLGSLGSISFTWRYADGDRMARAERAALDDLAVSSIRLSQTERTVGYGEGETMTGYTATEVRRLTVTPSASWLSASIGGGILTVKYERNPYNAQRTATVVLSGTAQDGTLVSATFRVIQRANTEVAAAGITLSASSLAFAAAGGSGTVNVTVTNASGTPSVTADQPWCAAVLSGDVLTVAATANQGGARTAMVTITAVGTDGATVSRTVSVTQAAAAEAQAAITLEQTTLNLDPKERSYAYLATAVAVTTKNIDGDITVSSSDSSWLWAAYSDGVLTVYNYGNSSDISRSGVITLAATGTDGSAVTASLTVIQAGASEPEYITFDTDVIYIGGNTGDKGTAEITGSNYYGYTDLQQWANGCTWAWGHYLDSDTYEIIAQETNETGIEREDYVEFYSWYRGTNEQIYMGRIKVVQRPAAASEEAAEITLSPSSLSFEATGGSGTVNVAVTNGSGTPSVSSNQSWCSASLSGNTLAITAAENSGSARAAVVTVSATGADGSVTNKSVSVTQAKAETAGYPAEISFSPSSLSFEAAGGSGTVNVTVTNGSGTPSVSSSESWCVASLSGNTLTVTATANSGAARTAAVTIIAAGTDGTATGKTLSISQAAAAAGNPAEITLSSYSLTLSGNGGSGTVNVSVTNASGAISVASSQSWCSASLSGSVLTISADANPSDARSAIVTVTATGTDGSVTSKTVTVSQAVAASEPPAETESYFEAWVTEGSTSGFCAAAYNRPALAVSAVALQYGSDAKLEIRTNMAWSAEVTNTSSSFNVSLTPQSGGEAGTDTVEETVMSLLTDIAANGSATLLFSLVSESGEAAVAAGDIGLLAAQEEGKPAEITLSPSSLSFEATGGSGTVNVAVTNGSGTPSVSSSESWCVASLSGSTLTITAAENSSLARTAVVTVAAIGTDGSAASKTVTVSQAGAIENYFEAWTESGQLAAAYNRPSLAIQGASLQYGKDTKLVIRTNMAWSASLADNGTGISAGFAPQSGGEAGVDTEEETVMSLLTDITAEKNGAVLFSLVSVNGETMVIGGPVVFLPKEGQPVEITVSEESVLLNYAAGSSKSVTFSVANAVGDAEVSTPYNGLDFTVERSGNKVTVTTVKMNSYRDRRITGGFTIAAVGSDGETVRKNVTVQQAITPYFELDDAASGSRLLSQNNVVHFIEYEHNVSGAPISLAIEANMECTAGLFENYGGGLTDEQKSLCSITFKDVTDEASAGTIWKQFEAEIGFAPKAYDEQENNGAAYCFAFQGTTDYGDTDNFILLVKLTK